MANLTPNDLSHLSDEDFLALCPQGYHAPGPEPLSPAAQAVLDAVMPLSDEDLLYTYTDKQYAGGMAAAALRATAERNEYKPNMSDEMEVMFSEGWNSHRKELLAIADELEAQ
jgi:hypothetical protein